MAIKATVVTEYGEQRELYIRLNNVAVSNHGEPAKALFRGFASAEAFATHSRFLYELELDYAADVTQNVWDQAYCALKTVNGFESATDC